MKAIKLMIDDESLIENGILQVAAMMEIAARTAPKSRGEDFLQIRTIGGRNVEELSGAMLEYGRLMKKPNFDRDSRNMAASMAVVLIGIKSAPALGLDCGACGYQNCEALETAPRVEIEFSGPLCAYRLVDLGIAIGSAVKTAQLLNVDNRVMYRIGVAARWAKMVDWDFLLGIPLSVTGKNIFFDRP